MPNLRSLNKTEKIARNNAKLEILSIKGKNYGLSLGYWLITGGVVGSGVDWRAAAWLGYSEFEFGLHAMAMRRTMGCGNMTIVLPSTSMEQL
jgi:hypothetical protein